MADVGHYAHIAQNLRQNRFNRIINASYSITQRGIFDFLSVKKTKFYSFNILRLQTRREKNDFLQKNIHSPSNVFDKPRKWLFPVVDL